MKRKGRVYGHVVLLPRVGVPIINNITEFYFKNEVQLSDCVIALKFDDKVTAQQCSKLIKSKFASLVYQYRGTGARYITIARLEAWLRSIGVV